MPTLPFTSVAESPTGTLRDLGDRLLKSCTRKPVDVTRWVEWHRGRRDLSFEMVENALAAGGKREYARAIYLQKAAELIDVDSDVPPVEDCHRLVIEADVQSDRVRQLVLLDGEVTHEEHRHLERALVEEQGVIALLLERLRRSFVRPMRVAR